MQFRDDPAHWEQRAREARSIAESLTSREAIESMLEIARSYEKLAELARARAKVRDR